ncbi:MAG: hypothetical protein Q8M31_11005 [Beijerinckiaceae bacterium]|nr:hypothetical protein [Beijerinckiaceae bacterium]
MSERSVYLRDQAQKCEWHASHMTDHETIAELRKLAAGYRIEAAQIECNESKE